MKKFLRRKIPLLMLSFIIIACTVIFSQTEAIAASGTGIQDNLNKVRAVYPNTYSYFTTTGKACPDANHDVINGTYCSGCKLPSIPARGGLPNGSSVGNLADTCCGFAQYVYYCVFGHNHRTQTTTSATPKFGDLVYVNTSSGGHWFIYLSEDSKNYYVFDANGYNGSKNKVIYNNSYPKSVVTKVTAYHATNYDAVNGSSSTQNPIVGTPTITSDKTLWEYGETVVLKRNTVQNTNYYWIVLWRGDKQVLSQKFENSTLSLSNLTEGKYRAYLQVGNSTSGTVTSEPFIFHVQGRITDSPQITSNKSDYFYGEDVTLIRNTVQSTNFYWIVLYRNGEMIASQAMDDEKMTMSNLEAGSYRLYLQVGNSISGTITSEPYFFTVNGDGWYKSNNKWMYYKNGDLQTGWSLISGKWYYFNASGIMQTGWLQLGGKWYYLSLSGAMVTGWGSIGGKWYYFNSSGATQTGWLQLGGKWYYLNSSGAMVTGWGSIGGKWYYFNNGGAMLTGWQQIGGKWYYFNSSGVMATGWIKLSGKWYYLNSNGAMATGTQRISGKTYRFNSSGVWIA